MQFTIDKLVELGALTLDKALLVSLTPLSDWTLRRPYTVGKVGDPVATLTVRLTDTQPPIWRQVVVPASIRLDRLHHVIQAAMGWQDSHLHAFVHGSERYGQLDDEDDFDLGVRDERGTRLNAVLAKEGDSMSYEYDFGDSWEHEITLDQVLTATPDGRYPRCVAGERACPPEDCGGTYGYEQLIKTLANPKDPGHRDMRRWLGLHDGARFTPAHFDVAEANTRLDGRLRVRRRT